MIDMQPGGDDFAQLATGGAYLGKATLADRRHVTIFVFPVVDTGASDVSIYVGDGKANSREPIPMFAVGRFIDQHLAMLGVAGTAIEWQVNPTWSLGGTGRRARNKARRGHVYFIADEQGFIKIGFSTNVRARLSSLSTSTRQRLEVLATVPGTIRDEADLHRRFAHLHARGEWFRAGDDLRNYIAEVVNDQDDAA